MYMLCTFGTHEKKEKRGSLLFAVWYNGCMLGFCPYTARISIVQHVRKCMPLCMRQTAYTTHCMTTPHAYTPWHTRVTELCCGTSRDLHTRLMRARLCVSKRVCVHSMYASYVFIHVRMYAYTNTWHILQLYRHTCTCTIICKLFHTYIHTCVISVSTIPPRDLCFCFSVYVTCA